MLIVIVRWRYNTTAPILIFDILLPVLPSVLTVLKIHLKRGSQNYVLFLGLPISVIQKKKKKRETRRRSCSIVKVMWNVLCQYFGVPQSQISSYKADIQQDSLIKAL